MGNDKKKDEQYDLKEEPIRIQGAEETTPDKVQSLPAPIIATDGSVAERAADPDETMALGSQESHNPPPGKAHNRQPSLSLQSQLRSSNFRRTSITQAPLSSAPNETKSPNLPLLSPEGDSINEIYRKQTVRLDELEKENKRLAKEVRDVRLRFEKAEEELEDLRESNAELAELRIRAAKVHAQIEEIDRLVHSPKDYTLVQE